MAKKTEPVVEIVERVDPEIWIERLATVLRAVDSMGQDERRAAVAAGVKTLGNNGTVQNRTVTIYGEEMEWRWRWFTWLPIPRMIRRSVNISFDDEVGERTGSWKGGTIGCSYDWRSNESMLAALRRMENERKF